MPKGIREYDTEEREETAFVQARIPKPLIKETKECLNQLGWSWARFLRASCRKLISEMNREDKKRASQ